MLVALRLSGISKTDLFRPTNRLTSLNKPPVTFYDERNELKKTRLAHITSQRFTPETNKLIKWSTADKKLKINYQKL